MNINPDRYDYRDSGNVWEVDVYSNNKVIATFVANKNIKGSIQSLGGGTLPYDFSKQEDVKLYIDFQFNNSLNKLYFDENGRLQKELTSLEQSFSQYSGQTSEVKDLGAVQIKYPPSSTSNNSPSNSLGSYYYSVEGDNTFGWKLSIFYNGTPIKLADYGWASKYDPSYTYNFPNNPKGSESVKAWAEYLIKRGFQPEYPPDPTFQNPPSSSPTPLPPSTPVISDNKGEVALKVPSSNDIYSNNPYAYEIKPDYGYNTTTNSTQKGWKIFISYNGIPINFLPDGPLLIDFSRNYDEAIEYVERLIRKTGFTDRAGTNYPPFEPKVPKAIITAPGFASTEVPIIKGDGTPKDLGVVQMTPIDEATELDKIEASQLNTLELEKLSAPKFTPEYFAQKKLTDLVISLKQTAIPLAITLISSFGITQASKLIAQGKTKAEDLKDQLSCPTKPEILKLIQRKNKLTKQLNNALKSIDRATKILGITGNVLTTLEIAFRILKNLPLPSAVPPGVGLPVNVILGIQDSKDKIDKTITKLKAANAGLLTILVIIRQILTQLLQLLSLLDSLIQECSPDNDEAQETVSSELLALSQQQNSQNLPLIESVNGFKMSVETENTASTLKRKRALAQNAQGVVMLKGEWSFSSIDQILIDELVFYIQQNSLKAD